jgi:type VI secretion system protein
VSAERTLLERLRDASRGVASRTLREDTNELLLSILRHLQKMLNSRQGNAPAQMDYGIPDPSEVAHAVPDAIGEMQIAIKQCIEKYEPRLTNVNVIPIEDQDDVLVLRYHIRAQAVTSRERIPVSFDTMVDASGRIQVKG